jgi:hypothetical protein
VLADYKFSALRNMCFGLRQMLQENPAFHQVMIMLRVAQNERGDGSPPTALHHDELHRAGQERAWWEGRSIDPIPIAAELLGKEPNSIGPRSRTGRPAMRNGKRDPLI